MYGTLKKIFALAPAWNGYDAFLNESQFWVTRRNSGTPAFDYTLEVRPSDYFGQVDEKIQPVIILTPVRGTIGVIYTMSLNGTMYSITTQIMQSGMFTLFNNTANTPCVPSRRRGSALETELSFRLAFRVVTP